MSRYFYRIPNFAKKEHIYVKSYIRCSNTHYKINTSFRSESKSLKKLSKDIIVLLDLIKKCHVIYHSRYAYRRLRFAVGRTKKKFVLLPGDIIAGLSMSPRFYCIAAYYILSLFVTDLSYSEIESVQTNGLILLCDRHCRLRVPI